MLPEGGGFTAGEKTEKATPKRRRDERKKGNIFQSKEVVTVTTLLAAFYGFKLLWPLFYNTLRRTLLRGFGLISQVETLDTAQLRVLMIQAFIAFAVAALPLLMMGGLVSILFTVAQTRGLFAWESLKPKFNRLNPIEGIKKLFSLRGFIELLKSLAKIFILAYIIYRSLKDRFMLMPRLMQMEVPGAMAYTGEIILELARTAAIIMVFVAAADYLYQWYEYEKNLRMSKQEIKEEYKQTEGDPQIKGKIKQKQQEVARQRMIQAVPTADVVIRNPTHYAVALKYSPGEQLAPTVVAKGADSLALRIVRVAEENGVVTMENKPLARGLYESVDLDREIPEQFYQPVAEVLAFVYNLKKKDLN